MQGEIYSIYHLTVEPAKFPAFKALVSQIVAATQKEPDTLTYEYVVNADQSQVHILEHYRIAGLLPHVETTFSPFAEQFMSLAKIDALYVYGETTPEVRTKLDGFGNADRRLANPPGIPAAALLRQCAGETKSLNGSELIWNDPAFAQAE